MYIELEKDTAKLEKDINTLKLAIKAVITSPEFISLFGKTQMLDADVIKGLFSKEDKEKGRVGYTSRRTRGDHSVDVGAMAARVVEEVYFQTFKFEKRVIKKVKENCENGETRVIEVEQIVPTKKFYKTNKEHYEIYKLNMERATLMALLAGYSHDLGHTPFGHDGELAINEVFKKIQEKRTPEQRRKVSATRLELFDNQYEEILGHKEGYSGIVSFEHTEQSYINFLNIMARNEIPLANSREENGIDLEVIRPAILAHSRSRVKSIPESIKGVKRLIVHAVRISDKGDYQLVDGQEMDYLIDFSKIKKDNAVNTMYLKRIDVNEKKQSFIADWVKEIVKSDQVSDQFSAIRELSLYRQIYEDWVILYCDIGNHDLDKIGNMISINDIKEDEKNSPVGLVGKFKGNKARNTCLAEKIIEYYFNNYDQIPEEVYQEIEDTEGSIANVGKKYKAFSKKEWEAIGYPEELITIGFISSLTNKEARKLYEKLVQERIDKGEGYGINPITNEDIRKINQQYTAKYIKKIYERLLGEKCGLSDDEKQSLEEDLREILIELKLNSNKITTEAGVAIEHAARVQRNQDALQDEQFRKAVQQADAERKSRNNTKGILKFGKNNSCDER